MARCVAIECFRTCVCCFSGGKPALIARVLKVEANSTAGRPRTRKWPKPWPFLSWEMVASAVQFRLQFSYAFLQFLNRRRVTFLDTHQ